MQTVHLQFNNMEVSKLSINEMIRKKISHNKYTQVHRIKLYLRCVCAKMMFASKSVTDEFIFEILFRPIIQSDRYYQFVSSQYYS